MKKFDLVVGSCFGDEGKGIITARLAFNSNGKIANVMTNGGPQRGHSVIFNGISHVFKHFGSATPFGAITFYDRNFILNPLAFKDEFVDICNKFHTGISNPIRDPLCKWTTPFDMMFNQIESKCKWKGTCGMGIWSTLCRYSEMPDTPSFDNFCKIMDITQKYAFLEKVKAYYETKLLNIDFFPEEYKFPWNNFGLLTHFIEDCMFMYNHTETSITETIDKCNHIIFENGQGLLLNDDGINDSEKTPSQTGSNSILDFVGHLSDFDNLNIHYVSRPYLTRHGSSTFKSEYVDGDIDKDLECNHYNEWQKDFLYANLNINTLKSRINKDKNIWKNFQNASFTLDITHCDELDREREFRKVFMNDNVNLVFHDRKEI